VSNSPYAIATKIFTISQDVPAGNRIAVLAQQVDAWLVANPNIVIRDVTTTRPQSTRQGVEALAVVLLYEYNSPSTPATGFGLRYRVLFVNDLTASGYADWQAWYNNQLETRGLIGTAWLNWVVYAPAYRRSDINNGSQLFAIYAVDDTVPGSGASRPIATRKSDYPAVALVEPVAAIDGRTSGRVRLYAMNGVLLDDDIIAYNVSPVAGAATIFQALPGERSLAILDQYSDEAVYLFHKSGCN
jgi:hypothetical protein